MDAGNHPGGCNFVPDFPDVSSAEMGASTVHWLSGGVEALAQGQLEHRVRSDRHDELGRLARGFNRMAERISTMLSARKQLLLDVSHELRSPITRMLSLIHI